METEKRDKGISRGFNLAVILINILQHKGTRASIVLKTSMTSRRCLSKLNPYLKACDYSFKSSRMIYSNKIKFNLRILQPLQPGRHCTPSLRKDKRANEKEIYKTAVQKHRVIISTSSYQNESAPYGVPFFASGAWLFPRVYKHKG